MYDKIMLTDELNTLTTCQEIIAELVSATPEGMFSTKKLAVLLDYLSLQQYSAIENLTKGNISPD